MKNYVKPSLELVEVSLKENIAALPGTYDPGTGVTTYVLNNTNS